MTDMPAAGRSGKSSGTIRRGKRDVGGSIRARKAANSHKMAEARLQSDTATTAVLNDLLCIFNTFALAKPLCGENKSMKDLGTG
jgi:hypothetical protein